jgi:hypothetical protein
MELRERHKTLHDGSKRAENLTAPETMALRPWS